MILFAILAFSFNEHQYTLVVGAKMFHCLKFEKVGFCITCWIGIVDIAYSKPMHSLYGLPIDLE